MPGVAKINHRGRKSGKTYETVVTPFRKGNTSAIVLGHGKTNWVKNVLAAGEADVHLRVAQPCTSSTRGSCPPEATPKVCRSWPGCRHEKWECSSPTSRDTLSRWHGKSG